MLVDDFPKISAVPRPASSEAAASPVSSPLSSAPAPGETHRLPGRFSHQARRLQSGFRLSLGKQLLGGLHALLVVASRTCGLLPLHFQHQEIVHMEAGRSAGVWWAGTEGIRFESCP